jgi:glycosyltransferase involved in cell wall biosynthesis
MKTYVICTFLNSFEFPVREAIRKQILWKAKEKQKLYDVSIVIFGNTKKSIVYEKIKIIFLDKKRISSYKITADYIDYMTTIVEFRSILSIFSKGKKTISLYDGYPLGEDKVFLRKLVSKLFPLLFSEIYVLSDYQKNILGIDKIKKISPFLPVINKLDLPKHKNPTLLYMGHISYFKGVDIILESYITLKKEIDNLDLIIANNMISGDSKLIEKVKKLKELYPDSIIIKGIVDPEVELSQAWIYLYPFLKPGGTMAFALSLYESQECGTPFIACDIGSNSEFFSKESLISNCKKDEMVIKIKKIFKEKYLLG